MLKSLIFAFTLVGTFVGAGFATGQEMISFFTLKNPGNPCFFILSSLIIFSCLKFARDIYDGEDVCKFYIKLFKKPAGNFLFFISVLSLFVCYGAAAAGMGSIFYESFSLPYLSGAAILASVSLISCIKGIRGINILNAVLTPIIIVSVIFFGIIAVKNPSFELITSRKSNTASVFFALLYAGYNIFPLIPVTLKEKKNTRGIAAAFIFTSLCGVILFSALKAHLQLSLSSSAPFEAIIRKISPYLGDIYAIIICMALVTTGASCLYGFISHMEKKIKKAPLYAVCMAATLLFLVFGFTKTVRIIYPISGAFGSVLIIRIIMYKIQRG